MDDTTAGCDQITGSGINVAGNVGSNVATSVYIIVQVGIILPEDRFIVLIGGKRELRQLGVRGFLGRSK